MTDHPIDSTLPDPPELAHRSERLDKLAAGDVDRVTRAEAVEATPNFAAWAGGWGQVLELADAGVGPTRVHIFSHRSGDEQYRHVVESAGACYGFVQRGRVHVSDPDVDWPLRRGQWFVTAAGCRLDFGDAADTRVIVAQRVGFRGLASAGGPVEARGRLRYIDRCSDTLLAHPPRQGDPCLNLLHFPPGISQTMHVHPSNRTGIVARGHGYCETPDGCTLLEPGLFFSIPADGQHRFVTEAFAMDVIAYHPDSDWGPTDEDHPMLSRTWDPETRESMAHDVDAQVEAGTVGGC